LVVWDNKTPPRPQGEFVVVVGQAVHVEEPEPDAATVALFISQVIEKLGLKEDAATVLAEAHFTQTPSKVRKLLKKGRILLKRSSDNRLP
jgi:hypothetical protein